METRHRRYDTDQATRRQATERFLAACIGGDLNALMEVLAPDVTMVSDGGGFTGAPRTAVHGRERAARAAVILSAHRPYGSPAQIFQVNDGPGIIIHSGRTPVPAATFHLAKGTIKVIHVVSNPEKPTGVAL